MWTEYHRNDKINDVNDEMQLLMRSLFNSILDVTEDFLYWDASKLGDESILYVERAFAYELYFRWNLNKDVENVPFFENRNKYKINAEIRKDFIEKITPKTGYAYPDMVLHGGNETDLNYIVCEIKRKKTTESKENSITDDLNKIGFFLRDDLNTIYQDVEWSGYRYGVFILTDKYWEHDNFRLKPVDIIDKIELSKIDVREDLSSKIICIIYDGKSLQYENLKNIMKNKNKKVL